MGRALDWESGNHSQRSGSHYLHPTQQERGVTGGTWGGTASEVKVTQACLTLWDPMDKGTWQATVHGIAQTRIVVWEAFPSSRGSSQPRIKPRSPALQEDSLLSEPPGKPNSELCLVKITNSKPNVDHIDPCTHFQT